MYVGDIVITGSDSQGILSLKILSSESISHKGFRNVEVFLGVEVKRGK